MTRFRASHDLRVGAVVLNEAGELLVVRHARRGERYWTVPGGSIELGESLSEAASREVEEETGYAIDLGDIVAVAELRLDRWSVPRVDVFFAARIAARAPRSAARRDGIVEVGWRTPHALVGDFKPNALLTLFHNAHNGAAFLGNVHDLNGAAVVE